MTTSLRTVFMGTPQFAADILTALLSSPYAPIAVYSQPDRERGRGRKPQPSEVKAVAEQSGLQVLTPNSLKPASAATTLAAFEPDLLIVAAYGLILPQAILDVPKIDCINVHASLLPRWRGAAPIERAIMAGDEETGVCIMSMEAGLDTGPVYQHETIPLSPSARVADVERSLIDAGVAQLLETLDRIAQGPPYPQPAPQPDSGATYADKLTEADRQIDWTDSAEHIAARVRALAERMPVRVRIGERRIQLIHATADRDAMSDQLPGAIVESNKRAIRVQCATGQLLIESLKFEGKPRAIDPAAALNGHGQLLQPGQKIDPQ